MLTRAQNTRIWIVRIMGVVVAFVGGIVFDLSGTLLPAYASPVWGEIWGLALLGALALEAIFWGFVAAVPMRSWWAALVVPLAFGAGDILTNFYRTGEDFNPGIILTTAMLLMALAAIGAAIGTFVIKRLERGAIQIGRPA